MASTVASILTSVRNRLIEPTAKFWSDAELIDIISAGCKDLWRELVDLKQEYFLTVDATNVTFAANATTLSGVPADVYKVYLIECRDLSTNSANKGLSFEPRDYNHEVVKSARGSDAIDPQSAVIYYSITGAGAPIGAPTIYAAPKVSSTVNLAFTYIPILTTLTSSSDNIPVPGECNNAIVAWTVAYARSKERDDRSPDPAWINVYSTEKSHLMESLGVRQYQEPTIVDAFFEEYWN